MVGHSTSQPVTRGTHHSLANCLLDRKMVEPAAKNYAKMLLASRSTTFPTAKTHKNAQITRYEGKELNFFPKFQIFSQNMKVHFISNFLVIFILIKIIAEFSTEFK